ncbi:MAG: response regulator [Deltaproteobacteria bacterium]|nr:response regulator [Deltaproteobacteria bacterium]
MINLFKKLKEMKIMLIDDDEWIRDSLSLFFESEGCHITALETAEEGMKELKNLSYDIIIVDYKLPGMSGPEFLKLVKTSHPHARTILITAYGRKDIFLAARKIEVNDFIDKPFTAKNIEESLIRLMDVCE